MPEQVIAVGENVIIITKRTFADDVRRHFIGTVTACAGSLVRVEGHEWIANNVGGYERRSDGRTRVISLSYGGEVVLIVPPAVDLARLTYRIVTGRLIITDDADFSLEVSEFGGNY
jgi:hypothetical protein